MSTKSPRHHVIARAGFRIALLLMLFGGTACDDATSPTKRGAVITSVTLTPVEVPSLAIGQSVTLHANVRDETGAAMISVPTWSSSDPTVARFQPNYSRSTTIVALRPGASTITAKVGLITASVTILVHPPGPVASVIVLGNSELGAGKTLQLKVVQTDSQGVVVTAPLPTFSNSDSTIVRVSNAGLVIALAQGTTTVTATSNGKSALKLITVRAPEHAFYWTTALGMIDLGTLPGFVGSRAFAVSSVGHVAGSVFTVAESLFHAFVREPGASGEMRDLGGLPGGGSSEAFGVNSAGQVVGYATTATGYKHAVLWHPSGVLVDLGAMAGHRESVALGINDAGQVVGWMRTGAQVQPFIWTETNGMRTLAGIGNGSAFAINQSGVVVGQSDMRPFTWNPAFSTLMLPLLSGNNSGRALAISNGGESVGISARCVDYDGYGGYDDCNYYEEENAVMWTEANTLVDLRRNLGAAPPIASALGINSARQVVGIGYGERAILWSTATGLRDLGVLPGRSKSAARAINDLGMVVGSSSNP